MNTELGDLNIQTDPILEQPDATQADTELVEDVNFISLVYRWQPMGIRITINLPYESDDITPLFAIKVGPYLPPINQVTVSGVGQPHAYSVVYPLPSPTSSASTSITATIYDAPPTLAIAAMAYRFWRGSMKYHLRAVSNFTVEGYLIATTVKGLVAREVNGGFGGTNTLQNTHRDIPGLDVGLRRYMINNYTRSDISMFRHIETTIPYEYPVPFYDQFTAFEEIWGQTQNRSIEVNCPDNFLVIASRGGISSPQTGAQLVYELEYCPGDDFQLSQEYCFSRQALEFNNYNVNGTTDLMPLGLPYTYRTS